MAEFETPEQLLDAARAARDAGYHKLDAYSPNEIHGLDQTLGLPRSRLPVYVLIGGIIGALTGYLIQYYSAVVDYPVNVGGRPDHSWPAFIIVTFELTILLAGLTAVVGLVLMCGLPRPYHPVFNVPEFERASQDRYFLCIETDDARFDATQTRAFLDALSPVNVFEVDE
jgi:hypothetical protein